MKYLPNLAAASANALLIVMSHYVMCTGTDLRTLCSFPSKGNDKNNRVEKKQKR